MLYCVLCSEIMIEIITVIGDFDYNEDRGENKGKRRNEVPVPPISPLTTRNHIDYLAEKIYLTFFKPNLNLSLISVLARLLDLTTE